MSTRPYVSFAQVKEKVSIPDVMDVLGLSDRFQRKGDTLIGVCPLPAHKHGPRPNADQFKIGRKEGTWLWHCFGDCQRGGDVIELVKELTGYDNAHVRFWFHEHFGDRLGDRKSKESVKHERPAEKDTARETPQREISQAAPSAPSNLPDALASLKPLRFRLNLDLDVPYLRQRGLTPETITRYGLGLCRRGVLKGYVAIPVYGFPCEPSDNPVAYLGRWPGDDFDEAAGRPRYKWPEGFAKSRVIYGLAEALVGTDGKPLIVVEGPFKVYHLVQAGFVNAVAIFGAFLSEAQAQLLLATERRIVLMFDGDEAGQAGCQAAIGRLAKQTFVRTVYLPTDVEPDDLTTEELSRLLG